MRLRDGVFLIASVLSISFLSGCMLETESADPPSVLVKSEQAVYGPGEIVRTEIENRTGRSVFFPRCDTLEYDLERHQKGDWQRLGGANICTANLNMAPIEVKGGEERNVEVGKLGAGRYRFVVKYGFEAERVGRREAVSSPFKVEGR